MQHDDEHSKAELDNRSVQLDPEGDVYWKDRGEDGRPDDWQERIRE